jgi:toxin FitB
VIILDTNVVSELMRRSPSPAVVAWADAQVPHDLYTTCLTQAEILLGIALLPAGKRQRAIAEAAVAMFDEDFAGRVLAFGTEAARAYAEIVARRRREGLPISAFDAQIAAIVRATRATLATRNVEDFEETGIEVVDPWSASPA